MNVKFVKGDWGRVREHGFRLVLAWPDVATRLRRRYGVASEAVRQKWPMADGKSPTTEGSVRKLR